MEDEINSIGIDVAWSCALDDFAVAIFQVKQTIKYLSGEVKWRVGKNFVVTCWQRDLEEILLNDADTFSI